jgi:hypothetical protein
MRGLVPLSKITQGQTSTSQPISESAYLFERLDEIVHRHAGAHSLSRFLAAFGQLDDPSRETCNSSVAMGPKCLKTAGVR